MIKNQQLINDLANRIFFSLNCLFCNGIYRSTISSRANEYHCLSCRETVHIWFDVDLYNPTIESIFITCNDLSVSVGITEQDNYIGPVVYHKSGGWHSTKLFGFQECIFNYTDFLNKEIMYNKLKTYIIFS